jgi:TRAP-type C4-dicarboxylate transport system permease small subunit
MQDRPSVLARLDRALDAILYHASAALIVALTGVILYAVVARYFFNAAPSWSEELPRVLFLWGSYLAVAVAVRRGQSLRVTVLVDKLPPGPRLALELFMHAAILVMLGYLVWFNIPVIELNATTKMLATQWSDAVRYWPLTVGCVLLAIYQLRLAIRSIEEYRTGSGRRAA